jgi:hypothetical protein
MKPWMDVLPSTWDLRCNIFPDRMIRKLKARFFARGDNQLEGVDVFDNFAPVCNCQSFRVILILSLIYDFTTLQLDYTSAFTQAENCKPPNWDSMSALEKERSIVYLEMSKVFKHQGKVLHHVSRNHFMD